MKTQYIIVRSKPKPGKKVIERLLTPGQKMLLALYRKKDHTASSLKEWSRLAKVGMSQIYNHMRYLEKLGYISVHEKGPYKITVRLTARGLEVAELLSAFEKEVRKDIARVLEKAEF